MNLSLIASAIAVPLTGLAPPSDLEPVPAGMVVHIVDDDEAFARLRLGIFRRCVSRVRRL